MGWCRNSVEECIYRNNTSHALTHWWLLPASYMDTRIHWWLRNIRSTRWWCWKFDLSAKRPNIGSSFSYSKILHKLRCRSDVLEQGAQAVIDLTDTNSEDVVFLTDSRSVLGSLAGHWEPNLRRKLYSILEHRRVVLQRIPAHCGIKGNEHADRLAKQEKLPITLKQKKINNKEHVQSKEDTRWLPHPG